MIINFNIERILVISWPLKNTHLIKTRVRRLRYVGLVVSMILCVPIGYSGTIAKDGCRIIFGLHSKYILLNIFTTVSGCTYIVGPILILPLLSIIIIIQVRKIMKNSHKLKHNSRGGKQNKQGTNNVKSHLGQLFIVIYTFICLVPNSSYFLANFGMKMIVLLEVCMVLKLVIKSLAQISLTRLLRNYQGKINLFIIVSIN